MRGDTTDALARLDGCGADIELIGLARDCLAAEAEGRPRDAAVVAGRVAAYRAGVQERLRTAELARAQADTRAEEERKRRKLALALAATVVSLMAVGGMGTAVYLQQTRDAAARLSLALREADLLRDQAAADPSGDPARWRAAMEAARRAGELEGALAGSAPRQELEALRAEVAAATTAAERDAELLRAVIDIRSAEADDPDGSASDEAYASAFGRADLDVDTLGPEAAGARIRSKPSGVATGIVAALDGWARRRRMARPRDASGWGRLVVVARAADPDPTRGRMRALWAGADIKASRGALLEMAREADVRKWPPTSVLLLARALDWAGERDAAVGLLRRAQTQRPGDVRLNYELAQALERSRPPRTEEAIGYYTAARALRPETGHELAHVLERRGRSEEAAAVLADVVRLRPGDGRHWACYGLMLQAREDRAGAAAALREEIRSRPDVAAAHGTLGNTLMAQGELDRAITEYREAIRLRPDLVQARCHLGSALRLRGKLPEAIAECRKAIRLDPNHAGAHGNLGSALRDQGNVSEALAEFREASRLQPDDAGARINLGNALCEQGNVSEALAEFREAIRLKPDFAEGHYSLGITLDVRGQVAEAIAEFREAIRLKPDFAEARCNLGQCLQREGRFQEGIAELRKGHELGSKRRGWSYPSAEWVRQAERMAGLAARLPAVLRGSDKPNDAAEGVSLAHIAYLTKRCRDSARLYANALRADPGLAEDLKSGHRYDAACSAALAGAGRDEDPSPTDDEERARWRKQAVAWLEADLAARSKQFEGGRPETRATASRALRHWKNDADLAGIRDPESIARLPDEEQRECRNLWSKVDALLRK
jgi:tetratricopeptide (TPR) repeat protein